MKRLLAAILALALIAGCGMPQKAANATITLAQSALDQTKEQAIVIAPDQVAEIQASIDSAKTSAGSGDYKSAILIARSVPDQVQAMTDSLPVREQELRVQWTRMQGLAADLDQFRAQIDKLDKVRSLPAGATRIKLDEAKASLETMTTTWVAAQNLFRSGNLAQAVSEASAVKEMLAEGMASLGMAPPDSLRS